MSKSWFKGLIEHFSFFLYGCVIALLTCGVVFYQSSKALHLIIIYAVIYLFFSILFSWKLKKFKLKKPPFVSPPFFSGPRFLLFIFLILFFYLSIFLIYFPQVPLFEALADTAPEKVALIRQQIVLDLPSSSNYLNSLLLRSVLPVYIVIAIANQRKIAFPLFFLSSFFGMLLMEKSLILLLSFAPLVFSATRKRWFLTTLMALTTLFMVISLNIIENRDASKPGPDQKELRIAEAATRINSGLMKRMFVAPGRMVVAWTDLIPATIPFSNGCGYRFLAKLLDCPYQHTSALVYEKIFVRETQLGLRGTANVASFVQDYSNFGYLGLGLNAFFLALIFSLMPAVFGGQKALADIFSVSPILLLSSASLPSTLASGGWILSLLLVKFYGTVITGSEVHEA